MKKRPEATGYREKSMAWAWNPDASLCIWIHAENLSEFILAFSIGMDLPSRFLSLPVRSIWVSESLTTLTCRQ